jgi:hypothetical protein
VAVTASGSLRVVLPQATGARIDHETVERVLIQRGLLIEPLDPSVRAIHGGHDSLVRKIRQQRAGDVALLIAPVQITHVVSSHMAGQLMPRKSTSFAPKPRSGVLLADLDW